MRPEETLAAGTTTRPLLEVHGLSVGFPAPGGHLLAIDGLGLSLERGEVLGLVGESGAGKSLTGAALAGLVPMPGRVLAGSAVIAGESIDMRDTARMARLRGRTISSIFQDPLAALDPLRRVGPQLSETIRHVRGLGGARARGLAVELLASTGLADPVGVMERFPHQLSGGMRQRVVVALAMAPAPRILVADEPTTALDALTRTRVLSLLRRLADEGLSVLLVSHDIGAIGSIADRIAVLYAGRIVESGPTVDVVSAPRHPYTRGLLASVPRLRGRVSMPPGREGDRGDPADPDPLAPIPGHPPALGATPTGCAFHPRCRVRLERCAGERPELASVDGRRLVACWRPHASGAPCP